MKLREPLTKENFFNELMEKYPKAMKIFCNWIDEYKKEVCLTEMFSDYLPPIKFHDLPFDMQSGIIIRFLIENNGVNLLTSMRFNSITPFEERLANLFVMWLADKDFQNI